MLYEEFENRHLRVAYCAPDRHSAQEAAELFGELVKANLKEGAEIRTVEEWARYAGKYGRIALAQRDGEVRRFASEYARDEAAFWRAFCQGSDLS